MTNIFDGKKFARDKEILLAEKIKKDKLKLKLVTILVGSDEASVLYTKLKANAAKRVGINFEIKKLDATVTPEKIIDIIMKLNHDKKVNGIMIQLPLPGKLKTKTSKIINSIDKNKDVDGLTKNSPYTPAAVRAVKEIIELAVKSLSYSGKKAAVVGANGVVGKAITNELKKMGYRVTECDITTRDLYAKLTGADLIISATGVAGLIKGEMIKEGVIAIDIGAPIGDFDFKAVADRAFFITPVPGGVGPVTVISLLENLVDSVYNSV
jgi:methylenetetrahydrofolate dehydrogenase (NADP+)/methenyltetrahydrofolate cyclohydrolase